MSFLELHRDLNLNTYQEKYDEWKSAFNKIYSSEPYDYSLVDNAKNLISYWKHTCDFYLLTSYQLSFDPLEVFKFLSTIGYIIISIILHITVLTIVLPITAVFFSPNKSFQNIIQEFIREGLIAIQSIGFALMDLIFQSIAFSLSILVRPFVSLYFALDYIARHFTLNDNAQDKDNLELNFN